MGLATGGDAQRTRFHPGTESRPTLAEAGINKNLAHRQIGHTAYLKRARRRQHRGDHAGHSHAGAAWMTLSCRAYSAVTSELLTRVNTSAAWLPE